MKMKNKKAEQIELKRRHRKRLKENRRTAPTFDRPEPSLIEKPTILIVCEGENTEPSYFKQFRLTSATINPIGEGYNTVSLVERADRIASHGTYDRVWCVFDKDDFSNVYFNNAISMAEANGFGVAYSNQAFEYWIILHFDDHQGGGMHRDDYGAKINELLKPYKLTYDRTKSKIISEDIFDLLDGLDEKTKRERKLLAVERAKRNLDKFDQSNTTKEESTTTVFKIIEELLKYI